VVLKGTPHLGKRRLLITILPVPQTVKQCLKRPSEWITMPSQQQC